MDLLPPDDALTAAQKRILEFIAASTRERGFPPTHREIARACRVPGRSSAQYHLGVLEARGLLKRTGQRHRGLELAFDPARTPILGRVGAGGGILAQEDVLGYISRDWDLLKKADFFLEVKGDSMTPELMEKDLVAVKRQEYGSRDGELVVALLGEETVVKRLRKAGSRWLLESANRRYPPIGEGFQVVGKVLGCIRDYGRR